IQDLFINAPADTGPRAIGAAGAAAGRSVAVDLQGEGALGRVRAVDHHEVVGGAGGVGHHLDGPARAGVVHLALDQGDARIGTVPIPLPGLPAQRAHVELDAGAVERDRGRLARRDLQRERALGPLVVSLGERRAV
ncbi:MAG: hypothetical protein ACK559_33740, partial [bacterium]